jgi:hypothetical protein
LGTVIQIEHASGCQRFHRLQRSVTNSRRDRPRSCRCGRQKVTTLPKPDDDLDIQLPQCRRDVPGLVCLATQHGVPHGSPGDPGEKNTVRSADRGDRRFRRLLGP